MERRRRLRDPLAGTAAELLPHVLRHEALKAPQLAAKATSLLPAAQQGAGDMDRWDQAKRGSWLDRRRLFAILSNCCYRRFTMNA
jgi:hypothetical protein